MGPGIVSYFDTDDKTKANGKEEPPTKVMLRLNRGMKSAYGYAAPIHVILAYRATVTTGVNTAYNTVIPASPSSAATEWAQLIALYDEVKVTKMRVQFYTGSIGATPGLMTLGCWAYDAANSAVLTSVSAGMQSAQHIVFSAAIIGSNTGGSVAYPGTNGATFWNVKVPPGSCRSASIGTNMGREWSATVDASDSYGFLKPYVEAGGAGSQFQIAFTVRYWCMFRCRT
jgi:hypothetical protein